MSLIDRVLEFPEYMNGESLEEFKKRVVLTPEQDVPVYLRECLERLAHLYPPREQLEAALRSLLAEAEASKGEAGKHDPSCDLCGYQIDAEAPEEKCFCYHPF